MALPTNCLNAPHQQQHVVSLWLSRPSLSLLGLLDCAKGPRQPESSYICTAPLAPCKFLFSANTKPNAVRCSPSPSQKPLPPHSHIIMSNTCPVLGRAPSVFMANLWNRSAVSDFTSVFYTIKVWTVGKSVIARVEAHERACEDQVDWVEWCRWRTRLGHFSGACLGLLGVFLALIITKDEILQP
jgi:hypothetical protein